MAHKPIFVFGSNLAGRHGKGAALTAAKEHGAVYGVSFGRTGNAFAIPTKDAGLKTLPLARIGEYVEQFKRYAQNNPELQFNVTRIGCGLAGYSDENIAPMFKDCPNNCTLPKGWISRYTMVSREGNKEGARVPQRKHYVLWVEN